MGVVVSIFLFVGLFYLALNRAKIIGFIGEKKLSSMLLFLNKDEYRIFNNLYIETSRGTSQIDHVVVSRFGIFVIETKSDKGSI